MHKFPKLSLKDYIKKEAESGEKCEYHDGEIFALAGGSINHGLLCGNIYSEYENVVTLSRHFNMNTCALQHLRTFQKNPYLYVYTKKLYTNEIKNHGK